VTSYGLEDGFRFPAGAEIFLLTTRNALGPTQPLIKCILLALFPGIKWPKCEADHSPPNAQFKNTWSCTSVPLYVYTSSSSHQALNQRPVRSDAKLFGPSAFVFRQVYKIELDMDIEYVAS
jgi:hypothetical protein